jgi:hypothetical protein
MSPFIFSMPREVKTIAVPEERFTQLRQMQNLNGSELAELTDTTKERTKNLAEKFIELQLAFLTRDSERPLREAIKTRLRELIISDNPELHFLRDPSSRLPRFTLFISQLEADLNNPSSELSQILKLLQLLKVERLKHSELIVSRTGRVGRLLSRYVEELDKIGDDTTADKTELNKRQTELDSAQRELAEAKERNPLEEFSGQELAELLVKYRKQITKNKTEEAVGTLRKDLYFAVEFVQKKEKTDLADRQTRERQGFVTRQRVAIAALVLLTTVAALSQVGGKGSSPKVPKEKITSISGAKAGPNIFNFVPSSSTVEGSSENRSDLIRAVENSDYGPNFKRIILADIEAAEKAPPLKMVMASGGDDFKFKLLFPGFALPKSFVGAVIRFASGGKPIVMPNPEAADLDVGIKGFDPKNDTMSIYLRLEFTEPGDPIPAQFEVPAQVVTLKGD